MRITTPMEPIDLIWQGVLEPPQGIPAATTVHAGIGRPAQWSSSDLLGARWKPPIGGGRYYLVQLVFSLRVQGHAPIASADFGLRLRPLGPYHAIVVDAYPRETLEQDYHPVRLGIGPEFKLGAVVDVAPMQAETTIDFGRSVPTIRSDGLAESTFYWRYIAHADHPLAGSRAMYAVLALPPGMTGVLATLELAVTLHDALDAFRHVTPFTDSLHCAFGE